MVSMTIPVADAMVKFVVPILITLFANRRRLTRQNAMPRIGTSMRQNDEYYMTDMALW